jgi:hypothetical protein
MRQTTRCDQTHTTSDGITVRCMWREGHSGPHVGFDDDRQIYLTVIWVGRTSAEIRP